MIPGAILSLVAAMRHWWRVAERGLKQKGIAIWLVAGALLMFSGFFYANVLKLLYIYHGCIGIGQSPFASWFETALIGESSNEFHWLPFVEFRVLYLPVWLIALVLWLINYAIAVRRKPPSGPLCIECGYNLKGNISGRCPECGTLIASETPT